MGMIQYSCSIKFQKEFPTVCNFLEKDTLAQKFFCEFWEIFTALAQSGFQQLLLIPHDPFTRRCVKSVQMWSYFWSVFSCIRTKYRDLQISVFSPNAGNYGPEITPYSDTFHVVKNAGAEAQIWSN